MEEYRDAGYLSDAFVNYLALLGWSLDGETTIIPRDVLASKFSLDRISKNPATFDPKKLDWVNAEYINGMSDAQFADEIMVPSCTRRVSSRVMLSTARIGSTRLPPLSSRAPRCRPTP